MCFITWLLLCRLKEVPFSSVNFHSINWKIKVLRIDVGFSGKRSF